MLLNQQKTNSFLLENKSGIVNSSATEIEISKKNKPPALIRKNRVGITTRISSVFSTNETEIVYSVDDQAIKQFKASIFHLMKFTNSKLDEIADPGANRSCLTKIKVYACFLKIGEIGNGI